MVEVYHYASLQTDASVELPQRLQLDGLFSADVVSFADTGDFISLEHSPHRFGLMTSARSYSTFELTLAEKHIAS